MKDQEIEFEEWLKDRPEIIKTMASKLKPWFRYRLKATGQHCTLYSYSENGTVTIEVDGHDSKSLNAIYKITPIRVFDVNPNDLDILG
jgi:hypothetical protein